MADYGADRYGYKQADMGAAAGVPHADSCKGSGAVGNCGCRTAKRETMPGYVPQEAPRAASEIRARVNDLLAQRHTMVHLYLPIKEKNDDWHGVADGAMDLRDIDAELKGLRWVLGDGE